MFSQELFYTEDNPDEIVSNNGDTIQQQGVYQLSHQSCQKAYHLISSLYMEQRLQTERMAQ